ncbi:MAG: YggT family protein [Clostridia bacterium]|nr:YggT family protein [Clostridia bacterium]
MLIRLIRTALYLVFRVADLAILVYCVASWFVRPGDRVYDLFVKLARIVEPVLYPVRKLMYRLGIDLPVDLSPWITMILLGFIYRLLVVFIVG